MTLVRVASLYGYAWHLARRGSTHTLCGFVADWGGHATSGKDCRICQEAAV